MTENHRNLPPGLDAVHLASGVAKAFRLSPALLVLGLGQHGPFLPSLCVCVGGGPDSVFEYQHNPGELGPT